MAKTFRQAFKSVDEFLRRKQAEGNALHASLPAVLQKTIAQIAKEEHATDLHRILCFHYTITGEDLIGAITQLQPDTHGEYSNQHMSRICVESSVTLITADNDSRLLYAVAPDFKYVPRGQLSEEHLKSLKSIPEFAKRIPEYLRQYNSQKPT